MYVGIVMKVNQSMSSPRQSTQVPWNPCAPYILSAVESRHQIHSTIKNVNELRLHNTFAGVLRKIIRTRVVFK